MKGKAIRYARLGDMLRQRRRDLQDEVRSRIRAGRADRLKDVGDELDHADAGSQGEIHLALLQMRAEALRGIEAALGRLDANRYGVCLDCTGDIAERRLRALPFALRCQACEEKREVGQNGVRAQQRGSSLGLLPDATSI